MVVAFSSSLFRQKRLCCSIILTFFQFFLISTVKELIGICFTRSFSSSLFRPPTKLWGWKKEYFQFFLISTTSSSTTTVYIVPFSSSLFRLAPCPGNRPVVIVFQFFLISTRQCVTTSFGPRLSVLPYFDTHY